MSLPAPPCQRRRQLVLAAVAGAAGLPGLVHAQLPAGDDPEASAIWPKLRAHLFSDRPLLNANPAQLQFSAPRRAEDPAFVPLAVRADPAAWGGSAVRRITLLIDNNPSPIAAQIDLPAGGALPELETRVRVDAYSFVRAIAECADGRLFQATRFVKASGGCSAPPGGDEALMRAAVGRMLFRLDEGARVVEGRPLTVQWMVNHPNHSGLAMDQFTRQYTPAEYVRSARLWQGERLLWSADLDFALSENPSLRFRFVPQGAADLRAEVTDTRERRYTGRISLAELGR
jgi:sulfur-oxidizing protein SoxY